ncbi:hypothetical protein [Cytobacillus oceanisediminis]|uniref:hypothetical protein n=1 Tax=Cytobacillus oceanisediminis TaxID=665099 RepID=UPI001FB2A849|nr:hypothetical protein [Cytobacillus oceanisediminis]UOE58215.1 hypothetical protein IRB79_27320 [Cytobacillus oceanisediminis]
MKKLTANRIIELYHIGLALWWGLCLVFPFNTFKYSAYAAMANLAPEAAWGAFALFIACGQTLMLFGKFKKLQPIGLAIASFFWTFIACMFLVNDLNTGQFSTGSGTYLLVSLMIFWLSSSNGGGKDEHNTC